MSNSDVDISLVIPAYNEGGRISPSLRVMTAFLGDNRYRYELIVVDDGSSDATYDVVRDIAADVPQITIIRHPHNMGKGKAVNTGFKASRGELVFFSDADHSTPIEELPKFVAHVHDGYDVVIGSRGVDDSNVVVHQAWYRENMGKMFNLLVRLLVFGGIRDTQCGFKCFHREKCTPVFELQRMSGFSFDVELLFLARKRSLRIAEVGVTWRNSPATHVSSLKDSLRMFRDLLRIRWNDLLGRYRTRR